MITAKVTVQSRTETGVGDQRQVVVQFAADYNDPRNAAWALYTPALNMAMTLKGAVADKFPVGKSLTLHFMEEGEAS